MKSLIYFFILKISHIGEGLEQTTYHTMEFATFIALWSTLSILSFTSAELSEIFGRLGDRVSEELYFHTTKRFSLGLTCQCLLQVESNKYMVIMKA